MRASTYLAVLVCIVLVSTTKACFSSRGSAATRKPPTTVQRAVSFSTLKNAYPTYARYPIDGKTLKQVMDLPDWLFDDGTPNTCAIRMSKAFNDAGLTISRTRVRSCSTPTARVNGNGNQYIIRALFFRCYLRAIWGSPDRTGIRGTSDISGTSGVLVFTGCAGFGQHIDLWDGSSCSMGCNYFSSCSNIELYTVR